MGIEDIIYDFGLNNNLKIGICSAKGFENIRTVLNEENFKLKGFVEQDIEKRIYPEKTLEDVKSIIVICKSYKKEYEFENDGNIRGSISMGAIGSDYHFVLNEKLEELAFKISNSVSHKVDFNYKIFVDTGPLVDREIAKRAMIGYIGKNNSIHCKGLGSSVFIGYMLTSLELNKSEYEEINSCGNCNICINRCPTEALSESGKFQAEKCISYLTQFKGVLNKCQMKSMGTQIYGCDICQNVCPKNKSVIGEKIYNIDDAMPLIEDILLMTNKDFKNKFGKTAAGWRGKQIIQRNALIALSNINYEKSIDILNSYIYDEREILSKTARLCIEMIKANNN